MKIREGRFLPLVVTRVVAAAAGGGAGGGRGGGGGGSLRGDRPGNVLRHHRLLPHPSQRSARPTSIQVPQTQESKGMDKLIVDIYIYKF